MLCSERHEPEAKARMAESHARSDPRTKAMPRTSDRERSDDVAAICQSAVGSFLESVFVGEPPAKRVTVEINEHQKRTSYR